MTRKNMKCPPCAAFSFIVTISETRLAFLLCSSRAQWCFFCAWPRSRSRMASVSTVALVWDSFWEYSASEVHCIGAHADCQVELGANGAVISLFRQYPGKAGWWGMWKTGKQLLFSRFQEGGTAKTRGKNYLRTETRRLNLASKCCSPAQNITRKFPKDFNIHFRVFSGLDLCWSYGIRASGFRLLTSFAP